MGDVEDPWSVPNRLVTRLDPAHLVSSLVLERGGALNNYKLLSSCTRGEARDDGGAEVFRALSPGLIRDRGTLDMHSQKTSKSGLKCKMVLQAVGRVLR